MIYPAVYHAAIRAYIVRPYAQATRDLFARALGALRAQAAKGQRTRGNVEAERRHLKVTLGYPPRGGDA